MDHSHLHLKTRRFVRYAHCNSKKVHTSHLRRRSRRHRAPRTVARRDAGYRHRIPRQRPLFPCNVRNHCPRRSGRIHSSVAGAPARQHEADSGSNGSTDARARGDVPCPPLTQFQQRLRSQVLIRAEGLASSQTSKPFRNCVSTEWLSSLP
jgi:hypothetical protein